VGIGAVNPYTSSALQIDSDHGGVLIPRMEDVTTIRKPG
jgi:hypothetical protein